MFSQLFGFCNIILSFVYLLHVMDIQNNEFELGPICVNLHRIRCENDTFTGFTVYVHMEYNTKIYMVRCLLNWHPTKISICIDYFSIHIHIYFVPYIHILYKVYHKVYTITHLLYPINSKYLSPYIQNTIFWLLMIEHIIGFIWQMRKYYYFNYEILRKWICTCQ